MAIEPVSNFIMLEKYAEDRSAATWTKAINEALHDLPVEVIQGTGDEAKGIRRHTEKELGAHHSPDVFPFDRLRAGISSMNWSKEPAALWRRR